MSTASRTYRPTSVAVAPVVSSLAVHYSFSAKERDTETGLSYFGARYYSSDLSVWLSVDPMSGKYPNESPYTYCGNTPIIMKDPNGLEKIISYNTTSGTTDDNVKNNHLANAAKNYAENSGVIHLWAHGLVLDNGQCVGINTYNNQTGENDIYNSNELDKFLSEHSTIYANNKEQTSILVLHCCKTGQDESIAQQASADLNLLVVAPSDNVIAHTMRFSTECEFSKETGVANDGCWEVYYKGIKIDSFSGSKPPIFDNPEQIIKNYEKEYQQLQERQTISN